MCLFLAWAACHLILFFLVEDGQFRAILDCWLNLEPLKATSEPGRVSWSFRQRERDMFPIWWHCGIILVVCLRGSINCFLVLRFNKLPKTYLLYPAIFTICRCVRFNVLAVKMNNISKLKTKVLMWSQTCICRSVCASFTNTDNPYTFYLTELPLPLSPFEAPTALFTCSVHLCSITGPWERHILISSRYIWVWAGVSVLGLGKDNTFS